MTKGKYSTLQIAQETGVSIKTIQRYCKKLGFSQIGGMYVLTDKEVKRVIASIRENKGKRGRPKKRK